MGEKSRNFHKICIFECNPLNFLWSNFSEKKKIRLSHRLNIKTNIYKISPFLKYLDV